jgi:hypothetical protein
MKSCKIRFDRASIVIAVFLVTVPGVYASSLRDIANKADMIIVGTVNSRTESPNAVSFDIVVERVIKGQAPSSIVHVVHQWRRPGGILIFDAPSGELQGSFYGIWCLQHTDSANWDILPVNGFDGFMPGLFWSAVRSLPPAYRSISNTTPLDTLVVQVAAGLESDGLHPEEQLGATGTTSTSALQGVFLHYATSPVPSFRAVGIAGMLQGGQAGAVSQLAQVWRSIGTDLYGSLVLSALRDRFRDATPSSVIPLSQLADVSSASAPELREAAVWALSAIHSKESLPFLASLLRSADPSEQARGVFGLAAFANGCPIQTRDNVQSMEYLQFKNPSPYRTSGTVENFAFGNGVPTPQLVAFWINWWTTNRASLT